MHIKFNQDSKCDFPRTTFRAGKTYSMPDHIAQPFIDAKKAEKVGTPAPTPKPNNQALPPEDEIPDSK
ncbi:MAG: hypothetical protein AAGI37_15485 [Planctomycetota bacterium]